MLFAGKDKSRMLGWLLMALAVYVIAALLAHLPGDGGQWPRAQVVLWRIGHLMIGVWLGYGADRALYRDRIDDSTPALIHIRRALIVGVIVIGMAVAL